MWYPPHHLVFTDLVKRYWHQPSWRRRDTWRDIAQKWIFINKNDRSSGSGAEKEEGHRSVCEFNPWILCDLLSFCYILLILSLPSLKQSSKTYAMIYKTKLDTYSYFSNTWSKKRHMRYIYIHISNHIYIYNIYISKDQKQARLPRFPFTSIQTVPPEVIVNGKLQLKSCCCCEISSMKR